MAFDISYVFFDVDGVLTDGNLTYTSSGEELKSFNAKDGFGINLLRQAGIKVGIVTARSSSIVEKRAKELKFDTVLMGERNKLDGVSKVIKPLGLSFENVAYIGDDWLDIPLLKVAGFSCAPSDAVEEVKSSVNYISSFSGGNGAVRDFAVKLLTKLGRYNELKETYLK